jgi:hypothetical protein
MVSAVGRRYKKYNNIAPKFYHKILLPVKPRRVPLVGCGCRWSGVVAADPPDEW